MTKRSPGLVVALATVAPLLPFLSRAFDIDEPLFLWMAQQISKHPFDPYGFEVNWASIRQPMWVVMQNPPLCSYYIAAAGSVFGWSEVALHIAFLVPAAAAILGTFFLARRFCREPLLAAGLTLFAPVFLVSATSVMCDVMLLAFWVWAIELWLVAFERRRWWLFLCAALAIAGAMLTKYFGICLVPLLFIYTVARQRRITLANIYLLFPVAIAIAYEWGTRTLYGRPLFSSALTYLYGVAAAVHPSHVTQFFIGCSFMGGCMTGVLFFVPLQRRVVFPVIFALVLGVLFVSFSGVGRDLGVNRLPVQIETALFVSVGIAILMLAAWTLRQRRGPESLLLFLWIGGTFFFAAFLNWSITARTLLPMAPAVAIATTQFIEHSNFTLKWWRISALAVLTLLVTWSDYRLAKTSRDAARHFRETLVERNTRVWFQSHWGFQWYMQRGKAKPMEQTTKFHAGDVIVIPSNDADPLPVKASLAPLAQFTLNLPLNCTTFAPVTGAGFYSSVRGPLPWSLAHIPSLQWQASIIKTQNE